MLKTAYLPYKRREADLLIDLIKQHKERCLIVEEEIAIIRNKLALKLRMERKQHKVFRSKSLMTEKMRLEKEMEGAYDRKLKEIIDEINSEAVEAAFFAAEKICRGYFERDSKWIDKIILELRDGMHNRTPIREIRYGKSNNISEKLQTLKDTDNKIQTIEDASILPGEIEVGLDEGKIKYEWREQLKELFSNT